MASALDLARRDLQTVWHPCTPMQDHGWLPMIPIVRGDSVWLNDTDGFVATARDGIEAATCD